MNNIHSPSVKKISEDYWQLDYYTQEKPDPNDYMSKNHYKIFVSAWEKSKQSIQIHPTQVKAFKQLVFIKIAKDKNISPRFITEFSRAFVDKIEQGIDLPSDRVEINELPYPDGWKKYAFLSDSKVEKQEKQETEYDFYKKQIELRRAKEQENSTKKMAMQNSNEVKKQVHFVECKDGCTYSRAIGQVYPRKCVNCYKTEEKQEKPNNYMQKVKQSEEERSELVKKFTREYQSLATIISKCGYSIKLLDDLISNYAELLPSSSPSLDKQSQEEQSKKDFDDVSKEVILWDDAWRIVKLTTKSNNDTQKIIKDLQSKYKITKL